MTEIFPRKNTGEKDEVIDRASTSSVTMSDRHVPSQSGAELGGARWGLCPPIILPGPPNFSGLFLKVLHRPLTPPWLQNWPLQRPPQMKRSGSAPGHNIMVWS